MSVLGDGAEWVWNLAGTQFAGIEQALDFHHAAEYLALAGRSSLGAAALADWLGPARTLLAEDGYAGACAALAGLPGGAGEIGVALNYLAGHRDRLGYAARLRRGQAIGSGLVEGTIKQRVNRKRSANHTVLTRDGTTSTGSLGRGACPGSGQGGKPVLRR